MLYITTRNPADSFTAHRVLHENRASDGGSFVPMQIPVFSEENLCALKELPFGDVVAQVLNLFFDKKLSGWDIGFSVGRTPVKITTMSHRLVIAQLWHNHGGDYSYLENSIYSKLSGATEKTIPEWPRIAIRIAVLFGVFSELGKHNIDSFDIAVPTDDFLLPVAAWYAKRMGLPMELIICGCSESSGVWDLIHRGEFSTAGFDTENLCGVERLIFDAFGREEALRYLGVSQRRGVYKLTQEQQAVLNQRLFGSVISEKRLASIVKSVFRTNDFILDLHTAASYGALQDYRARTGESRATLILADRSPVRAHTDIGQILGLSRDEIENRLNTQKE
ncbi:MAG: hypothetical protein IJO45_02845 [Oscillospiraceae bacterium]|nr:hypothetical protein [Oscillospiraceae bacterium]